MPNEGTTTSRNGGPLPRRPIAQRWKTRTTKVCSRCFVEKPLNQFGWYVDNRQGTQRPKGACIGCSKIKSKGEYARKVARGQPCSVEGCDKPTINLGLCAMHYRRQQREGYGVCTVEGCDKLQQDIGLCPMHRRRLKKFGDVGPAGPARWRNGTWDRPQRESFINDSGYRMLHVPTSPMANSKGYVIEHRYVMTQDLGRDLYEGENVHHINGVKSDNRLENLELWVTSQPSGQRPQDLVIWATKILNRYGESVEE